MKVSKTDASGGDRTLDLEIMRLTRYLLRYRGCIKFVKFYYNQNINSGEDSNALFVPELAKEEAKPPVNPDSDDRRIGPETQPDPPASTGGALNCEQWNHKRRPPSQMSQRWITAEITLITDLRRLIYQNWSWINTSDINMSEETGKRTPWTKLHHEDARMNP
ncbi:hypothetical protein T4E_10793 [Trichinella pseudospiralis]|uniref:Uncharacterized protein n=1 Tax=Trichinella pseudospiralis TaxID=6337 RepID=A0A0V0Y093_TRIPS|nr:hypothetical protein T4E_10793 [Trichinella pseudospiralis]